MSPPSAFRTTLEPAKIAPPFAPAVLPLIVVGPLAFSVNPLLKIAPPEVPAILRDNVTLPFIVVVPTLRIAPPSEAAVLPMISTVDPLLPIETIPEAEIAPPTLVRAVFPDRVMVLPSITTLPLPVTPIAPPKLAELPVMLTVDPLLPIETLPPRAAIAPPALLAAVLPDSVIALPSIRTSLVGVSPAIAPPNPKPDGSSALLPVNSTLLPVIVNLPLPEIAPPKAALLFENITSLPFIKRSAGKGPAPPR